MFSQILSDTNTVDLPTKTCAALWEVSIKIIKMYEAIMCLLIIMQWIK
jgi:hypothetical protein